MLDKAQRLHDNREFAASMRVVDNYLDSYSGDSVHLIPFFLLQGDNFYSLGMRERSAELYNTALLIADTNRCERESAKLCNRLFKVYYESGNNEYSGDLLRRALTLYRNVSDREGELRILNNLGLHYYLLDDNARALDYMQRALAMAEGDSVACSQILTNIAEVHYVMGEYGKADGCLDKALSLLDHRFDTSDALQAWLNKSLVAAGMGRVRESRAILAKVDASMELRDPERLAATYEQLAQIRLLMGDSVAALRDLLAEKHMSDSIQSMHRDDQLQQLLTLYNTERLTRHNEELRQSVRRRNVMMVAAGGLTLLLIGFAIFLTVRIRSDRRKNNLIREQREQLLAFEQREREREAKEYRRDIDHKNRQLTSFAIDAAAISELHKKIHDSLASFRPMVCSDVQVQVDDCQSLLRNFSRAEVSEDFRVYFNEVHPDLLKKLAGLYPALTSNDLRLCSYLYLGMTTKEIGALTLREVRSVESSRLRLRKKLGLPKEQSLHQFLHSLENNVDNQ